MMEWILPLVILSLIVSTVCVILSIFSIIEVKAMQKSTHSIQYVPLDPPKDVKTDKDGFELIPDEYKKLGEESDYDNLI